MPTRDDAKIDINALRAQRLTTVLRLYHIDSAGVSKGPGSYDLLRKQDFSPIDYQFRYGVNNKPRFTGNVK